MTLTNMQPSQESKLASSKSRQWATKQAQEQALEIWNASKGNERDTRQPDFFPVVSRSWRSPLIHVGAPTKGIAPLHHQEASLH